MHILKKKDNAKGILIITHKEIEFLASFLKKVKNNYFVLAHFGSIVNPSSNYGYIDYFMISDSRCKNQNYLPFTSRNFLNNSFNNMSDISETNENIIKILKNNGISYEIRENNKIFDFICINRANDIKKTYDLLKFCINKCREKDIKCCFIILENNNQKDEYYKKIIKFWNENKTENLLFIDTHEFKANNKIYKGLNMKEISQFYKSSKIYMHGCESEGESRTIHEALCCGCMILAKKNMKGGGLDYLNDNNSLLYNNDNYSEKMSEILKKYDNFNYDIELYKKLNEEYTCNVFLKLLHKKFNYDISYEYFKEKCDTEDLQFSLPAHNLSLPWYIKGKNTSDILSKNQIKIFQKFI